MRIGMVGLGRMGGNMARRLRDRGHEVIGYSRSGGDVASLEELVDALEAPRVVWVMVPAGEATDAVLDELSQRLEAGDLVVEGGNSHYPDSLRRHDALATAGIRFVDVGVSGGIWGLEVGYGLMVGGADEDVDHLRPLFDDLTPDEGGFSHVGGPGGGHYTKMVHNGIEYGLMQAYAEGYELLRAAPVGVDVGAVLEGWRHGTVVRSWLLDLLAGAVVGDPDLARLRGYVDDSGEGRWTVQEAVDRAVPTPVIAAALFARFSSRQDDSPAMRALAALRREFGGHEVRPAEE